MFINVNEGNHWANKTVERKAPKRCTFSLDGLKTSMELNCSVEMRMAKGAFFIRSLFGEFLLLSNCDTMWVVRQADDPFVCFGTKPNKGLSSRSLIRPEVGEEKQVREKPEARLENEPEEGQLAREASGAVVKGTQRGSVAKRDAERQSRTGSRRDQSRWVSSPEWTTVRRRRQWRRRSKMSWHS